MSDQPVDTGDTWRWVDRLTESRRRRLVRRPDGGQSTVEHVDLPSLLEQLAEAQASTNSGGGRGKSSGGSRAPLDLTITSLLAEIETLTVEALIAYGDRPRYRERARYRQGRARVLGVRQLDLAASVRALAVTVVDTEDADLIDWWASRFCAWVLRAEEALDLDEDGSVDVVPVRGVPCPEPECGREHVLEDRDGETVRTPALAISFRDGQVLHVTCRHCGTGWWRGEGLNALADAMAATAALPSPAVADEVPSP
ncbi:hypothetical protein [Blastococcus sp. TF02A-26]|uniref:DUF7341 domain-containing protein n=1 Tax=Blastococcus sp. TF02A-26 TaxID=2250577 RepID=UPI0013147390|nr:hypothetical protein [Blastococcus sp. TF02A-26]